MGFASKLRTVLAGARPAVDATEESAQRARPPVTISDDIGSSPDDMDILEATDEYYAPPKSKESLYDAAKSDPEFAARLPKYWRTENPSEAFSDFLDSGIPNAAIRLMERFGVKRTDSVCEVGCGAGHLSYSLMRRGFTNLSAMDPSADPSGYLRKTAPQIHLIKDLGLWQKITGRFDAIISNGTIHHWHHIPLVTRDVRKTLKPGGYWFASTLSQSVAAIVAELARYGRYAPPRPQAVPDGWG
jgi:SAM-dependent methyltransferase